MNIEKYIDHTNLKADATKEDIIKLCTEAKEHGFFAVCVNPYWVPLAVSQLSGSDVQVATVVGFPLGATTTDTKVAETQEACLAGAKEVDVVINIGSVKAGDFDSVFEDINLVCTMAHEHDALVKVILETCLLTEAEIVKCSKISMEAGADFIKTSTGFSTGGATEKDVQIMRKTVDKLLETLVYAGVATSEDRVYVKASGGIRDFTAFKAMIDAGADRIGTSNGVAIINEAKSLGIQSI